MHLSFGLYLQFDEDLKNYRLCCNCSKTIEGDISHFLKVVGQSKDIKEVALPGRIFPSD
jgi:hypothetical protein